MSSQTPHAGRADALHTQVQDFAHEHAAEVVVVSFDGRLVSLGGALDEETAERFAGTAYGIAVTARWADHELERRGVDTIVVRFGDGFWVVSPVHGAGWLAVGAHKKQNAGQLSYRTARLADRVHPLLPEHGELLELPSPLSGAVK
ncbi:roadblock/LC7 domain-containing protein [Nocardiopsis sp. HNM0947]|uniref:Roadblock/LC7 domain-containing protein n=1 Tax=Nocardiopsis coralli TaxID=2772213 RepID=A0ABR9P0A1_9ACTN|nr:roadblock/LC7 domain-containing protein [Nocardiopsis coralli]MBE2997200.1 roadblock/LC7 domain-containing protein [Nocardiopsis coralli]